MNNTNLNIVKEMYSDARFPCWQPILSFSLAASIHLSAQSYCTATIAQ